MWGIGYISSDCKEDRDDEEVLDDEDELFEEATIIQKLHAGQGLNATEMETVGYSQRLKDVYNTRWWNNGLQAFFVHYNVSHKTLRAGDQIFYEYGNRSDDYLVEQYGFCLEPNQNPFSSWKFRVMVGVSPTGEIEDIAELLPTESMYEEEAYQNIDNLTETICL